MRAYQFRIKDSKNKVLCAEASLCNYVWNSCNEKSKEQWETNKIWISQFDMQNIFAGSSKEIGLNSATIQLIAQEHAVKRQQFKNKLPEINKERFKKNKKPRIFKGKLNWRTAKRQLGWIPFDTRCLQIVGNVATYNKHKIKFKKHKDICGKFKAGSFTQNAQGHWYINIVCEEHINHAPKTNKSVGIDLGFKEVAVSSKGEHFEHPKPLRKYAEKLATAQRANHKKQVTNIHQKIKNIRKDFNHKLSTYLVETYDQIFVGNVNSQAMIKRGKGFAKSTLDASWGQLRTMLEYKANRLGKVYTPVNEAFSTITCSVCSQRTGPSGLSDLGVREWTCNCCGTKHQRDVNSATCIEITGLGH